MLTVDWMQDFIEWRKTASISLEEESSSRKLTAEEEMSIPSDLDTKLGSLRSRILPLLEHWTKVVTILDRIAHRRQNQGGDYTRLKVALDAVVEQERSGWRVEEVESVERATIAFGEEVGRAGLVVENAAEAMIERTVVEAKRVRLHSFPAFTSRPLRVATDE
jgi:sorting nexin-8